MTVNMMDRWFLIDDVPASGAENMARDEYLLAKAETDGGAPVLRLYSFDPAAITIGYHQDPLKILDIDALVTDGMALVRRITGGRALLHDGELTYSIVAPLSDRRFQASLQGVNFRIATAVAAALRSLGVDAAVSNGRAFSRNGVLTLPCLASSGRNEITAGGRKIVGSAQRRTSSALLQHGSILLRPASGRIQRYLSGDWGFLEERITSISGETGRDVDHEEVREVLVRAVSETFDVSFEQLEPGSACEEAIRARTLDKESEFAGLAGLEVTV